MRWFKRGPVAASPKVFCVGLGKTGTTSLGAALRDLGYRVGDQPRGERLFQSWLARDFEPIIEFCRSADAFQDVPFSLPYTYQALDRAYPDAHFILTRRESAEQWYDSLVRFHSRLWADGIRAPTAADLQSASYRVDPESGIYEVYHTGPNDPYNRPKLLAFYRRHLDNVRDYFSSRPSRWIEIDVSVPGDYGRLCRFLDREPAGSAFPWLNRSPAGHP